MNTKAEASSSRYDALLWLIVAALVAAGVIGNAQYAELENTLFYRSAALMALAAVAGYIACLTSTGKSFVSLLKEAQIEVRKVVWPTKNETMQTTALVTVVVFFMAIILFGVDWLLNIIVEAFLG